MASTAGPSAYSATWERPTLGQLKFTCVRAFPVRRARVCESVGVCGFSMIVVEQVRGHEIQDVAAGLDWTCPQSPVMTPPASASSHLQAGGPRVHRHRRRRHQVLSKGQPRPARSA